MTKRTVLYFAHPVGAPSVSEFARNITNAKAWLAWLMLSEPTITFVAPWMAAILSGADDDSPTQRERGLLDAVEVVGRCDGIVLCGGRISTGMRRELDATIATGGDVYDLTSLGDVPWLPGNDTFKLATHRVRLHDFVRNGDDDSFRQIEDGHGAVVLTYCRRCGCAEDGLDPTCTPVASLEAAANHRLDRLAKS